MTTFALLVGIDAYQGGIPQLRGCVADAHAMNDLILQRDPAAITRLLLDQDATKAGFVQAFDEFFAPAAAGDTAILWYSGHGSQLRTSAGVDLEPDGWDETLVFVDSRLPERNDMRDKELGALLASLSNRDVRVVVGLDACHSGGGTREELQPGVLIRRAPADTRVAVRASGEAADDVAAPSGAGWSLSGSHVLLAACRADQTAKERPIAGQSRGVFSAAVERVLRAGAAGTYRELLPLVRDAIVAAGVVDQVPQVELIGSGDTNSAFLGGDSAGFVVTFDSSLQTWALDAGAVHGIPQDLAGSTRIECRGTTPNAPVIATLTPTQVDPQRSLLRLVEGELVPGSSYPAAIVGWSLPRIGVALPADASELAQAVEGSVLLTADPAGPLQVVAYDGSFAIVDSLVGGQRALSVPEGPVVVATILDALERMARWHNLRSLANPSAGPGVAAVTVRVKSSAAVVTTPGEVTLPYVPSADGGFAPPRVEFVVHNAGTERAYCGLFLLDPDYAVTSLLAHDVVALDPGQQTLRAGRAVIPEADGASKRETVLLITSTEQFESWPLLQPPLANGVSRDAAEIADLLSAPAANTLAAVLRTSRTRDFDFDDLSAVDWATRSVQVVIERTAAPVAIEVETALGQGVTLLAPDGLGGSARVTSSASCARDLIAPLTPPMLLNSAESWAPFSLQPVRDALAPLDVLELTGVETTAITPETPLQVRLDQPLHPDEHVVVVGFDGTDYLPVGFADRSQGGDTSTIRITTIPDAISDKSLASSIRLLFRSLWGKFTGGSGTYLRLAVPTILGHGADRTVEYNDDEQQIVTLVKQATSVLVIIHGIIGDTEGLVIGCADSGISARYDLVLAVDYENLYTTIDATAQLLHDKLAAVGLGAAGPPIDIVAHSMGGLVSRWMIEVLPGRPNVHRLVTAGTPNNGSPWATIENWAAVLLGLGMNQLATVFWPAKIVGWLVAGLEKVDNSFDQLVPNSPIMKGLAAAPDPAIQYVVVLGDRAAIPAATGRVTNLLGKLLHKAGDIALALAFLGQINDLAVSQESGESVPYGRVPNRQLMPGIACDHLTYFSSAAGQAALVAALEPVDGSNSM